MTKTTFIVTDPAGVTHTRTSENHTYAFAVASRRSYEREMARAKTRDRRMSEMDKLDFHYHLAYVNGTSKWLVREAWQDEARHAAQSAESIARSVKELEGCTTYEEYATLLRARRIAHVEKAKADGVFDRWSIEGWTSRGDLAEKLQARTFNSDLYADVVILEASIKA